MKNVCNNYRIVSYLPFTFEVEVLTVSECRYYFETVLKFEKKFKNEEEATEFVKTNEVQKILKMYNNYKLKRIY